jgi:hypothetical protein
MTDRDEHERELPALFDDTADVPSAAALTRSRARAKEIPARVRRRRSAMWLGLLAIAGVLAMLVPMLGRHSAPDATSVARAPGASDRAAREPIASVRGSTPAPAPPSAVVASSEATESELAIDDVDDLGLYPDDAAPADSVLAAAVGADFGADEFELLYEPPRDADLDAWLRATDDLLQGGG